jgi:hypothetical protein
MTRAALAAIGVSLSIACGSSPASPGNTGNNNTTGVPTLRAGDYLVTVSTTGFNGGATGLCVVFSAGGSGVGDTVTFTATVAADGSTFTLRPAGAADLGMVATLKGAAAGMISGPVAGQARDSASGAVVAFAPLPSNAIPGAGSADPTLVGFNTFSADPNMFSGPVTGLLTIEGAGASRSCSGGSWTMRAK